MRIVSFLSSATEIVFELGLGDALVGISHECDYPPGALHLPRLSRSRFDPSGMTSGEIDREVRRSMEEHGSVYDVDVQRLREIRPDLILTQAVCEVCAVPTGSVDAAVEQLSYRPEVLSLDAHTLEEILETIRQVADAAGVAGRGSQAVARLRERVDQVRDRTTSYLDERPNRRPSVLALEWLDPPFIPGHWVPEMIHAAGGDNLFGSKGDPSWPTDWATLADVSPERLLLIPCGYGIDEARSDADRHREPLRSVAPVAIASGGAWIGNGAYFSRSGPRVVDGIEALARAFFPDLFPTIPLEGRLEAWA